MVKLERERSLLFLSFPYSSKKSRPSFYVSFWKSSWLGFCCCWFLFGWFAVVDQLVCFYFALFCFVFLDLNYPKGRNCLCNMKTKWCPSVLQLISTFPYHHCLAKPTATRDFYCLKILSTIRLVSDLWHSPWLAVNRAVKKSWYLSKYKYL